MAEAQPGGVRFPDSLIQAYLASRLIETAMADKLYRSTALATPRWELLTALVMSSRVSAHRPEAGETWSRPESRLRKRARARGPAAREGRGASGVTVLELYAAALQIDCVGRPPAQSEIAGRLRIAGPV